MFNCYTYLYPSQFKYASLGSKTKLAATKTKMTLHTKRAAAKEDIEERLAVAIVLQILASLLVEVLRRRLKATFALI
jgi:hypothetical protein